MSKSYPKDTPQHKRMATGEKPSPAKFKGAGKATSNKVTKAKRGKK